MPVRRSRYDFVHGRMRDVAYEATSLARRRLLHRRTAEAIRARARSARAATTCTRFALIAGHEREAGRPAEAAAAFVEAADRAEAVFANREAIDHLEAAIALGHLHDAAIHARIGELRARLGEYPAAIAALETAAALRHTDELPGIEIALGRVHRRRGDLVAAASHLDAALACAPDSADELRARGLVERSVVALRAGDLDIAEARRRAEARVSPTGRRPPLGRCRGAPRRARRTVRAATCRPRARPSSGAWRSPPTTPIRRHRSRR